MNTRKIRTAIVDDEPLARKLIARLLSADPDVQVVAEAANGTEAARVVREDRPELIFLDIRLPDRDGLSVLRRIPPSKRPIVIFVTSYAEHAVAAFDVHADDFLLKPLCKRRFRRALARAKRRICRRRNELLTPRLDHLMEYWQHADPSSGRPRDGAGLDHLRRLLIRRGSTIKTVEIDEVDWFSSADHYVEVHSKGRTYLVYESISRLEAKLDPTRFVRIHRKTIVNLAAVRGIRTDNGYSVVVGEAHRLRVSDSRRDLLCRLLLAGSGDRGPDEETSSHGERTPLPGESHRGG